MEAVWITLPTSYILAMTAVCLLAVYVIMMSWQNWIFRRISVVGPDPWPAVGNFPEVAKIGVFDFQRKYFDKYVGHKVYGYFDPGCPIMVVRDLDLLRDVTIKHFNHFVNRRPFLTNEKPFDTILTALTDDHWRSVRQTLSPTFSSGKLRRMCQHVDNSSRALAAHFREYCETGAEVDLKDIMGCYTLDCIASAGFGVDLDSLKDKSSPFARAAKKIVNFSGLVASFVILFPPLVKVLIKMGWTAFDKESVQFLSSFINQAVEGRKSQTQGSNRHDFLQLLINAEKTGPEVKTSNSSNSAATGTDHHNKTLSREEIQGQALIFLLASYDTVATVLSFGLFAIAHHPDICLKIQQELDTVLQGEAATYDNVQKLEYLEQCLYEALRLFTPIIFVDRVCTEDCTIGDVFIPKGMVVMLPVFAIHRNKDIWPDPDTFDPDRFKVENKERRHPFAHMAFGHGPRNCIGMRLALLEMKAALASILKRMTPVPCEKSVFPPRLSKYQMRAVDGLWVKMTARKQE